MQKAQLDTGMFRIPPHNPPKPNPSQKAKPFKAVSCAKQVLSKALQPQICKSACHPARQQLLKELREGRKTVQGQPGEDCSSKQCPVQSVFAARPGSKKCTSAQHGDFQEPPE